MVQRIREFVAAAVKGGQSVARPLLREARKVGDCAGGYASRG